MIKTRVLIVRYDVFELNEAKQEDRLQFWPYFWQFRISLFTPIFQKYKKGPFSVVRET